MTEPHHDERPTAPASNGEAHDNDRLRALAQAGDWRTLLQLGRFELADQTRRFHPEAELDAESALALGALVPIERAVRQKRAQQALDLLDRIDPKPPELLDWSAVRDDLAALHEANEQADLRQTEAAGEALAQLRSGLFEAEVRTIEGTLAVGQGESEQAAALFDAALALDPKHLRALTNRGNLKLEAGDVDGAIADYQAALAVDDGFANAHHNLGVAYRRKGNIGKSVASLRRAQRASLRSDADAVRARRGGGSSSTAPRRNVRWLYFVAIGAVLWWFLRQQGMI